MALQEKPLSITQQQAGINILQRLTTTTNNKLILLEGLSGVGKTTVLTAVEKNLTTQNTIVDNHFPYGLLYGSGTKDLAAQFERGSIISPVTPFESEEVRRKMGTAFPKIEIADYVLKGMPFVESLELVRSLKRDRKTLLPDELLAEYSLGIPLLIERFLMDTNLTEDAATILAGTHLGRQLSVHDRARLNIDIQRYLQTQPSNVVIAATQSVHGRNHIYEGAGIVLDKMKHLKERGITEESPFFVARKSVDIYNQMLERKHGIRGSTLDIFVPELKPQDLERAAQALGFNRALKYGDYWLDADPHGANISEASDEATRFNKAFGGYYRKAAIWFRALSGDVGVAETETPEIKSHAQNAEKDFLAGDLPIKPSTNEKVGRLFFHKHAHHDQPYDPAKAGWAVESLLQQRGLPYLVRNGVLDTSYFYDPSTKSINFADFDITKYSYDWPIE